MGIVATVETAKTGLVESVETGCVGTAKIGHSETESFVETVEFVETVWKILATTMEKTHCCQQAFLQKVSRD